MLILNDVHIGFDRQGGTTPASREALRSYLFQQFEGMLYGTEEAHLCIQGDLFDKFEIDTRDWLQTFLTLSDWLTHNLARVLTLVAGNHDHSPKALRVSSFELLCKVLVEQYGDERVQVIGIDGWEYLGEKKDVVALAHCSNQDIFDLKLRELLDGVPSGFPDATWLDGVNTVLLHCNFDNNFAVNSDHSLNVSRDMAREFTDRGITLCFAHEHQAKRDFKGKVTVFGNQWPTSISDCLSNEVKNAHTLVDGVITPIQTWSKDGDNGFIEIDWRELSELPIEPTHFVRVSGTASQNEAGDCITAIAKFRAKAAAFVITNAVKIEGIADNDALPESFEATKAFDVMEFVNSNLDEPQQAAVRKLSEVVR